MKSFRTTEYKILAYWLALVYLFYFLARIAFYSFNQAHLRVDGIADFLHLAFYGLLFDTTAIIYVNLLFIFLSVLPLLINTKPIFQNSALLGVLHLQYTCLSAQFYRYCLFFI